MSSAESPPPNPSPPANATSSPRVTNRVLRSSTVKASKTDSPKQEEITPTTAVGSKLSPSEEDKTARKRKRTTKTTENVAGEEGVANETVSSEDTTKKLTKRTKTKESSNGKDEQESEDPSASDELEEQDVDEFDNLFEMAKPPTLPDDKVKLSPQARVNQNEILDELEHIKRAVDLVVNKFSSPSIPWGRLSVFEPVSQIIPISGSKFSFGHSAKCSMVIKDSRIASALFQLTNDNGVINIECLSSKGALSVNNETMRKGQKIALRGNEEITVTGSKTYRYKFQKLGNAATIGRNSVNNNNTSESSPSSSFIARNRARRRGSAILELKGLEPFSAFGLEAMDTTESEPKNSQTQEEIKASNAEMRKALKEEFLKQVISSSSIDVSFSTFPYHLNDTVKQQFINTTYIYLMKPDFAKYIADLPITRRLILCGPTGTELYQERLTKALASHFGANLFVLEPSVFEGDKEKISTTSQPPPPAPFDDEDSDEFDDWDMFDLPKPRRKSKSTSSGTGTFCRLIRHSGGSRGGSMSAFDENPRKNGQDDQQGNEGKQELEDKSDPMVKWDILIDTLSEMKQPCILLIKEIETSLLNNPDKYPQFKQIFSKIPTSTPLVVIGSSVSSDFFRKDKSPTVVLAKSSGNHTALLDLAFFDQIARIEDRNKDFSTKVSKMLLKLFPSRVMITPPSEPAPLSEWTKKINKDIEQVKLEKNIRSFRKVLDKNNIQCADLNTQLLTKSILSIESVEKIVAHSVSNHLMTNTDAIVAADSSPLQISLTSLEYGINVIKEPESKTKSLKDIEAENEFERKLIGEVIPPNEIDVKFEDIGALDEVKETLRELVMLPLQRPELFSKGSLTKPPKGILLFGPPGTGKTMLAKAVATQCGANFINISMSTIASKWFGEGEKYVKAIFTLASKISPTVIFIDEVDSILGKRDKHGEHEAMRKIKNEFMSNWDGLKSKENERVLVLAATNRPFDLDDAVLRRLSRRLLVDLPNAENRAKILKIILSKEDLKPGFDIDSVAAITDGFSGSDLKNLCVAAAYHPVRELLQKEKEDQEAFEKGILKEQPSKLTSLRLLTLADFEKAVKEVSSSVSEDAFSIAELRKWNEMYGEGGSRKKGTLPYFL